VIESLEQLRRELEGIGRRLTRVRVRHLNTRRDKKAIRDIVSRYFSQYRPKIVAGLNSEEDLEPLDGTMQDLLRCTRRRTQVSQYRELVKVCRQSLDELEIEALKPARDEATRSTFEPREELILETLRKARSSAAPLYEQALTDLRGESRKSWRGTAVEFREALRETLDAFAPDDEVKKDPRFQPEPGAKGPTMKQKVAFILRSRRLTRSEAKTAEDAVGAVDEAVGKFVRSVYDRASTGVHTEITKAEAQRIKEYVTVVLVELLEVGE
jgi:hypothetical protein